VTGPNSARTELHTVTGGRLPHYVVTVVMPAGTVEEVRFMPVMGTAAKLNVFDRELASQGGRIRKAGYDPAGGNFIVLTEKHTGLDAVYMHLAHRPHVRARQTVETNQRIGSVGDTGNADGCHLHFELWSAPGWYAGGVPFDPLPRLRRWDAQS